MPENTVSVCRPGRFGNPFIVGPDRTQRQAVKCFRVWLTTPHITAGIPEKKQAILEGLESLRGKNLACFCGPGTPCHADVLLDLANKKNKFKKHMNCPHCGHEIEIQQKRAVAVRWAKMTAEQRSDEMSRIRKAGLKKKPKKTVKNEKIHID